MNQGNGFEYISTFISLILGLGVASVLANYADYFKNRDHVRWYWLHLGWGVYMLGAIASEWWVSLNWRGVPSINYFQYLFMLGKPCVLFFGAALLMADQDDARGGLDLRAHYYSVSAAFLLTIVIYVVLDQGDTLLKGFAHYRSLGPGYPIGQGVLLAILLWGALTRRPAVHVFVFIATACLMLAGITNALFTL